MKVKKSYVNAVKDTLKCYHVISERVKFLNKCLGYIKNGMPLQGISYEGTKVQTSNISKMTENTALKNIEDEQEIKAEIALCEKKTIIIEAAIDSLSPIAKQIIILRYKEKMLWIDVVDKVLYSERHCKYMLTDGIKELAVIFYGEKALEQSLKVS